MLWIGLVLLLVCVFFWVLRRAARGAVVAFVLGCMLTITIIVTAISFVTSFLVAVPAGHVGVPVVFGNVRKYQLSEGLHLKNPFAVVEHLSVRTEIYTMSSQAEPRGQRGYRNSVMPLSKTGRTVHDDAINAVSSDGLRMPLDCTVVYRLVPGDAPWVYRNLGYGYATKIIRPAARTAIREAVSKLTSQEAYSTKREALAAQMQALLTDRIKTLLSEYEDFSGTGFLIQQVMLRNVDLPPRVKSAIEEKLSAEQDAVRMHFVLMKESQEAKRKEIEAKGIAEFQKIVTEGISEQLLRWKGIEATAELATSDNAKVVIVGGGKDGLSVILNTGP